MGSSLAVSMERLVTFFTRVAKGQWLLKVVPKNGPNRGSAFVPKTLQYVAFWLVEPPFLFISRFFMNLVRICLVGVTTLLLAFVVQAQSREDQMLSRMQPVGSVCMSGDACAAAPVAVVSGPRSAEEIYTSKCQACHLTGALNAPVMGNAEQWAPRIAQGTEVLHRNAIEGIQVDGVYTMPVKGLCMDCSDEEIIAAVDYMVGQSQ